MTTVAGKGRADRGSWARHELDSTAAHPMRDQRQRRVRLVSDDDRQAERVLSALDTGAIVGEDRRERLAVLDPVARPSRDDEPNTRINPVFHLRTSSTERDDAAADRPRLDPGDETTARCVE